MTSSISRRTLGGIALASLATRRARAEKVEEIRIDWATYNPVSLVLRDQNCLKPSSPRMASPSAG